MVDEVNYNKMVIEQGQQISKLLEISENNQSSISDLYGITKEQAKIIFAMQERHKYEDLQRSTKNEWSQRKMVAVFSVISSVLVAITSVVVHFL